MARGQDGKEVIAVVAVLPFRHLAVLPLFNLMLLQKGDN
jgi:hypothetical protein